MILSIKERRDFLRDIADHRDKVEACANYVDEDWDTKKIVSVDDVAASGVCNKLKEARELCRNEQEPEPPFVTEMVKLSREVVETKRNNAKFVGRVSILEEDSKNVRSEERLACINPEAGSACTKTLEA